MIHLLKWFFACYIRYIMLYIRAFHQVGTSWLSGIQKKWRSLDSVPVCLPRAPESIANGPYMCLRSYLCCGSPLNSTWARRYNIFGSKSIQIHAPGSSWEADLRHGFAKIRDLEAASFMPRTVPHQHPEHVSWMFIDVFMIFIETNMFWMCGRRWMVSSYPK